MEDPSIIGLPPDRVNIKYIIESGIDIPTFCRQMTDDLILKRSQMEKTVVFCRSLQNSATIFATIKKMLGTYITDPPGAMYNGTLQFRLVEIFTSVSTTEMREAVLKEFCKINSTMRLLVATTAFGMGVDCPDIAKIINWGCPNTLEELVQETGRGGRDGRQVQAILYPTRFGKKVTSAMKSYQKNTEICRRRVLFENFLFNDIQNKEPVTEIVKGCHCCDLCTKVCSCVECKRLCI